MQSPPKFGALDVLRWPASALDAQGRAAATARLRSTGDGRFAAVEVVEGREAILPFDTHALLRELRVANAPHVDRVWELARTDAEIAWWLDGSSAPIHACNGRRTLRITAANVVDYVRFFLFFVRGEGAFVAIETAEALRVDGEDDDTLGALRAHARVLRAPADGPPFVLQATISYQDALFSAQLTVGANGDVTMDDDTPIAPLAGVTAWDYADLVVSVNATATASAATVTLDVGDGAGESSRRGGKAPAARPTDRRTTEAFVAVLLDAAIRSQDGHRLLQRFNAEADSSAPRERLRRFMADVAPVVALESDIPFVEEIVVRLLDPDGTDFSDARVLRMTCVDEAGAGFRIDEPAPHTKLVLASFHRCERLFDAERTAFQISTSAASALIGCVRLADVPDPLCQIVDLTLPLPRLDAALFEAVYSAIFGAPPPADWARDGSEWVRYLRHADFHAPVRLRLGEAERLEYLRGQVTARLETVSAGNAPQLADLAGLGAARDAAEDLVADVRAAVAGRLPWSAVSRGLLLVGPPGTGKTTLARAIARACDVKFLPVSAADWASSGHLAAHLRAIRDSFDEARRYAPTLLFIDEIDSLGNRGQFAGPNASYDVEIVNAVLAQLQGMDEQQPVILLAATNSIDRVDPALRRPGRLDQTIEVELPNAPGLAGILTFYLYPLRAAGQVAADVDETQIAPLALGSSGADVESFVRGAARRARRRGEALTEDDLIAEIMRQPTRPVPVTRFTADELRRTAVHEAGHVISLVMSGSDTNQLAYVSIVPTTTGALGWTAHAPTGAQALTRTGARERLRTLLAGRAAEELVFGVDHVGAGAGGDQSSDLAVATRFATYLVCRSGLHGVDALRWTESPSAAQFQEVDALLRGAHAEAVALLERYRTNLDRIVERLVREQQIPGDDIAEMFGFVRVTAKKLRLRSRDAAS